ncbi:hypothetical protein KMZ32_15170 [Phycicoccus sp. MAQZ13P-2]|uniref:hypothetical protein n=1 Tax=Phycicoccus mangrovi TaxID=2840470 RepID=UPI001C000883|nr:hypothetical protein [Phycicoccus mangrovi]MBT9257094.1 hypothetical protein [Phycicoccus mangrovi]MBT9275416.1 hypothetical protein [Phycicoccus mangrovi]
MTTIAPPTAGAAPCAADGDTPVVAAMAARQPLFPPADADAETFRAWLAASPWPEVVFASAGAR